MCIYHTGFCRQIIVVYCLCRLQLLYPVLQIHILRHISQISGHRGGCHGDGQDHSQHQYRHTDEGIIRAADHGQSLGLLGALVDQSHRCEHRTQTGNIGCGSGGTDGLAHADLVIHLGQVCTLRSRQIGEQLAHAAEAAPRPVT